MGVNRTCYSWRMHPEIVRIALTWEQVAKRHRCRHDRGHDGVHDCGRLPCFGFPWRTWGVSAVTRILAEKTRHMVLEEQSRRALA